MQIFSCEKRFELSNKSKITVEELIGKVNDYAKRLIDGDEIAFVQHAQNPYHAVGGAEHCFGTCSEMAQEILHNAFKYGCLQTSGKCLSTDTYSRFLTTEKVSMKPKFRKVMVY